MSLFIHVRLLKILVVILVKLKLRLVDALLLVGQDSNLSIDGVVVFLVVLEHFN